MMDKLAVQTFKKLLATINKNTKRGQRIGKMGYGAHHKLRSKLASYELLLEDHPLWVKEAGLRLVQTRFGLGAGKTLPFAPGAMSKATFKKMKIKTK